MTLGAVGHRHKGAACVAGPPLHGEAPCSKRFARAFRDCIGYSPVGTWHWIRLRPGSAAAEDYDYGMYDQ
ncbi:hypothetical protein ABT150_47965 [Streptomyces mirabilis]|uniref:hypothetical protein n=1 Tax=Streptomyces mirabilis TaxID=68239 RepID=UPI003317EF80